MNTSDPVKAPDSEQSSSYYRLVWRWHFYAGMLLTPLFLVVVATGGIYLYAAEIGDLIFRDALFAQETGESRSYEQQIRHVTEFAPGSRVVALNAWADPSRMTQMNLRSAPSHGGGDDGGSSPDARGEQTSVYVNPYTGQVREAPESQAAYENFFGQVLDLHRELWVGMTGRALVELTTSWLILLIISGVYLWWPRSFKMASGVWWPRLSAKRYVVLRDLHTIAGIYFLPLMLIILITGLFYSLVWGESFYYVTKPLFAGMDSEAELSRPPSQRSRGATRLPPIPPRFTLDDTIDLSRRLFPGRDLFVTLPRGSSDHYRVIADDDYTRNTFGAMESSRCQIHRDTGEVIGIRHLWNNDRYWWHTWAYPLHVGSVLGHFSKALWMLATLVLLAMPFTGIWMWWERRPKGKTGFPRRVDVRMRWGIIGTILLLCVLLPTAGLSIAAIAGGDWLLQFVLRRLQRRPVQLSE